jgi:hypothetical protein
LGKWASPPASRKRDAHGNRRQTLRLAPESEFHAAASLLAGSGEREPSARSKWFERDPDFDWADGGAGLRDAGKSLKLWSVLFSASGRRQPSSQRPDPGVAKQSRILYSNDRILSSLQGQTLTTHRTIPAFCNTSEVMELPVAGAGRRAVELSACAELRVAQPKRAPLVRDTLRGFCLRVVDSHRANERHFLNSTKERSGLLRHGTKSTTGRQFGSHSQLH